MSASAWGDQETQFFFELDPASVLDAVEEAGFRCTGNTVALNSYENRVYEIEVEREHDRLTHPWDHKKVAKFYRPGRWSKEQILEEHQFLQDLLDNEVPAIAPLKFPDGTTLKKTPKGGLWYCLFPKVGGRIPQELKPDQLQWMGRLLSRMHAVGCATKAQHRIELTPATYGRANLQYLLENEWLPPEVRTTYETTVQLICDLAEELFEDVPMHRIHGDCHLSNILWDKDGPFFLDFDDMVTGPAIQDFWLLLPGRDEWGVQCLDHLIEGYEMMRPFEDHWIALIEPLRSLRFVHFTSWIARRWEDPAFPVAFPEFNTIRYWTQATQDLQEQLVIIREEMH